MTREEAIQRLYRMGRSHVGIIDENTLADNKALSMAIEALSADRPTIDKEYLIDLIQEAVYDGEACAKLIDLVDRPTGECRTCGRNADNDGVYEDGRTKCPIQEHYALPLDGYCHLYEPYCGAVMKGGEDE